MLQEPLDQEPYLFDYGLPRESDQGPVEIQTHPDFGCVLWKEGK